MDFSDVLYTTGLILVVLYLLMGVDDFIWDSVTFGRRSKYMRQRLDLHTLDFLPPKLLAVAIAAWHEDNVLGDVIDNLIESTHYPKSMYHIFLGIYPNDTPRSRWRKGLPANIPMCMWLLTACPVLLQRHRISTMSLGR